VISLDPEFITPQDGYEKQDCEVAAAKRWLHRHREFGVADLRYESLKMQFLKH